MNLRPYQTEAIELLRQGFRNNNRQVLCLPTGAGKTVIFSDMIRAAVAKGTQTLVITDRIELCAQTLKAIASHNINPQIVKRETKNFSPLAPVTLAMVETISRRMKKWAAGYYSPGLIVIDEAHKKTFSKIMDAFPDSKVIGATATPKSNHLHKYYTNIVNNIDIQELISQGFLAPCRAFMMQDNFDDVKVVSGEYDEKQLFKHYDKVKLYKGVVDKYQEKILGQKCLVFNVNIEHAVKMNDEFNKAGIRSHVLTSETPADERKHLLAAFEAGHFPVLQNCGILTTGVDIPSIQAVIMNRATKSLTLWLQCCGRGSRTHHDKPYFTVLDFGNNHTEHGMWAEHREWSLEAPKKKKKGVAPVRNCPKCSAMLPASARKCDFCGHVFPVSENLPKEGVMVEVKAEIPTDLKGKKMSELSIADLVRVGNTKAISKPYIWRVVRSRGKDELQQYCWQAGYKQGWFYNQMKELNDCSFRDRVL